MKPVDFKGKRITIMGLGLQGSGISAAKFFSNCGAKVTVTDIKTKERLRPALEQLKKFKNIVFVLGQHRPEDFSRAHLIIKGPGVPNSSKYLEIAKKNKVPIESEAGIFFELVKNPIIGITGTRGKSTTTKLIHEILKNAGRPVLIGGNIKNQPLFDLLPRIKKDTWLVLELSSFQLEGIETHKKSPHIGIALNLLEDHLNRYKNLDHYHQSKKTIVKYQTGNDYAVLNYDDEKIRGWAGQLKSKIWYFSLKRLGGENVIFIQDKRIILKTNQKEETLLSLDQIRLIGRHRLSSILAGVAAGVAAKIPLPVIKKTIEEFKGLEHRLEVVRDKAGVLYVNDTTATTPEAAERALESFAGNLVLIAGGADKNLSYDEMAKKIIARVRELILLPGKGTDRLVKALRKNIPEELGDYEFQTAGSIEEAVALASQLAQKGEVVLMSPGCSSFGLFENEFERGDRFREAVEKL